MNGYDKLKSIIQAANEEIMDLKFGCEVKLLESIEYPQYEINEVMIFLFEEGGGQIADTGDYDEYTLFLRAGTGHIYQTDIRPEWKILGRPIRLADVLLAYHKKFLPKDDLFFKAVLNHVLNKIHADMWSIIGNWNLLDNDLDYQSEETKQFLINLLV